MLSRISLCCWRIWDNPARSRGRAGLRGSSSSLEGPWSEGRPWNSSSRILGTQFQVWLLRGWEDAQSWDSFNPKHSSCFCGYSKAHQGTEFQQRNSRAFPGEGASPSKLHPRSDPRLSWMSEGCPRGESCRSIQTHPAGLLTFHQSRASPDPRGKSHPRGISSCGIPFVRGGAEFQQNHRSRSHGRGEETWSAFPIKSRKRRHSQSPFSQQTFPFCSRLIS